MEDIITDALRELQDGALNPNPRDVLERLANCARAAGFAAGQFAMRQRAADTAQDAACQKGETLEVLRISRLTVTTEPGTYNHAYIPGSEGPCQICGDVHPEGRS